MSDLRRCPFCGGKGELWNNKLTYRLYGVICEECDCMTPYFTTREQAIEAWNRREPIDRIVEQLEAEEEKAMADYHGLCNSISQQAHGRMRGLQIAKKIVKGGEE